MMFSPIILTALFVTAILFAATDFVRKLVGPYAAPLFLLLVIYLFITPLYGIYYLMTDAHAIEAGYVLPAAVNILSNLGGNFLFIRAVTISPLSKTIPILSLSPVFACILSFIFLSDVLTIQQLCGIALSVLGVLWLYVPADKLFGFSKILENFRGERGALYMLGAAFLWTVTTLSDRLALQYADVPSHALIHFVVGCLILLPVYFWAQKYRPSLLKAHETTSLKKLWGLAIGAAVLYALAIGGQMYCMMMEVNPAILEAVKRVIGQFSAVLLGYMVFAEPITKPKICGICLMSVGVPLVILS